MVGYYLQFNGYFEEDKMSNTYWFPEWNVLCWKYDETHYGVMGGAWDFRYEPSTGLRYFPKHRLPINDIKSYPIEVTKKSFKAMGMDPEEYYW